MKNEHMFNEYEKGCCLVENDWMQTIRICHNCGQKITGYRKKDGLLKIQCPVCGACMVCKFMSRRHERIDVYAPPNLEINN